MSRTYTLTKRIAYLFMAAMLVTSLALWQAPMLAKAEEAALGEVAIEEVVTEAPGMPSADATVDASDEDSIQVTPAPLPAPQNREDPITPQGIQTGTSGTCTWTFDDSTKVLTIKPTTGAAGTLASSNNNASNWPWNSFASTIETVEFIGNINTASSATGLFSYMSNLTTINNLSLLNTSGATQLNSMFNGCTSLTSLDLSTFKTANVTLMNHMFYNCSSLTSVIISSFATSRATDMSYMFAGCSSLEAINFPGTFNTVKVTNMNSMLYGCSSLTSLDLSVFSTTTNTGMTSMFTDCTQLTQVTLGAGFAFRGTDTGFPAPSGINAEGKPYTGKWKSVKSGYAYAANAMPSNVADTYIAETFDTILDITGPLIQGEMMVASLSDSGGIIWSYQWARGDSAQGPFTAISGATEPTYITTVSDANKYLKCTASSGTMNAFSVAGPIQGLLPDSPTLSSATLASDGVVTLGYTTAASISKPYTHIVVEYQLDSGIWMSYGQLDASSTSTENKIAQIDLSSVFSSIGGSANVYFRIKAKNLQGESGWSNTVAIDKSPQISVTVPTEMTGLVTGVGDITATSQVIKNNGTLDMKVVNIAMAKNEASYPTSSWVCYQESDAQTPLWQGDTSTSSPVATSPLLTPQAELELSWFGTMKNTNGITLSASPVPYGSIVYTVGFAKN